MISLPHRQDVQRIVHYQGRRPWRALFFVLIGYLLGWYVCAYDNVGKLSADIPTGSPATLFIGCGQTPWACIK